MNLKRIESIEKELDAREKRRFKADERAHEMMERQMENCEYLIGELCREGMTIYYVITKAGKVKEFSGRVEACDYLIRNSYVSHRRGDIPTSSGV
jgi:hypothetical protein